MARIKKTNAMDASQNKRICVLIRHGESQWNAKGVWTGLTDIGLSDRGKDEAKKASQLISDIQFNYAFTSVLKRATQTLDIIVDTLGAQDIHIIKAAELNERDYGIYTGKNKFEIQKKLGKEEFLRLRRGWDYPIPKGESLKQVYARVVPYWEQHIAPFIVSGNNVMIVAHGNSLRALVKKLECISDSDIPFVELATGEIRLYYLDSTASIIKKEIRA